MTLDPDTHHHLIATDPDYRESWFSALARTVAVDFDGVLHPYTDGWVGPEPADEPPTPGAAAFLAALLEDGYRVVIFSSRCDTPQGAQGIAHWLATHDLAQYVSQVTNEKVPAVAYVDDRAVVYRHGNWTQVRGEIGRLAEGRAHGAAAQPPVDEQIEMMREADEEADPYAREGY